MSFAAPSPQSVQLYAFGCGNTASLLTFSVLNALRLTARASQLYHSLARVRWLRIAGRHRRVSVDGSAGARALILLAPFQRLPDDFGFIRGCEMPQKSLANFLVNEHGECTALRMPPSVQLDRKMALIDASLKRRRIPHFRKYYRRKQRKL